MLEAALWARFIAGEMSNEFRDQLAPGVDVSQR
jgi:hypothetical protein